MIQDEVRVPPGQGHPEPNDKDDDETKEEGQKVPLVDEDEEDDESAVELLEIKKQGFFGRVFQTRKDPYAKREKKAEVLKPKAEDLKPEHRNWETIDVREGVYSGKDLSAPKQLFEKNMRHDVADVVHKFSKQNAIAKAFSPLRKNKITKSEVRKTIENLHKEGKINNVQARKLRRKFGAGLGIVDKMDGVDRVG